MSRHLVLPVSVLYPQTMAHDDQHSSCRGGGAIYTWLAFLLAALFLAVNAMLFVPAHRGVDQNGYLVGGKMLARNGSMAYRTVDPVSGEYDPFLFVGRMWVGYDLNGQNERYYPKYPIGLPALYALALNIGGESHGVELAYWISPVCMAIGLLAVFFLVRLVAPPLYAFMATAVMCAGPLTGWVTHNPNSHASNFFFAAWGMYFLFAWWQKNGFVRAVLAGLLIGCAATIRYTDALLLIPVLLVLFFNRRETKSSARSIAQTATMLVSWALPVGVLLLHNAIAFGHATGYDTTNESSGFSWEFLAHNWDHTIVELSEYVLLLTLPFGIAGMIGIFWWSWKKGLVILSWVMPTFLIYSAYYWAPDGLGYSRFFLILMPALLMCVFWLLSSIGSSISRDQSRCVSPTRISLAVTSAVTILAFAVGMRSVAGSSGTAFLDRALLFSVEQRLSEIASPHSIIVSQERSLLHHLQFASDYRLYSQDVFDARAISKFPSHSFTDPQGWQPQQRQALFERLKDYSQRDLDLKLQKMLEEALESGETAFFIRRKPKPPRSRGGKPVKEVPLVRPAVAPPKMFCAKIVHTWPMAIRPPFERRKWGGGKVAQHRYDLDAWQLIQVTLVRPVPSGGSPEAL